MPIANKVSSPRYASGKYAKAVCDTCGFTVKYLELKEKYVAGKPTGIKQCEGCLDVDHPLNFPVVFGADAEALEDPRPE